MTISINHYDFELVGKLPDDSNMEDIIRLFIGLLVASGWHINTVNDGIVDVAKSITNE